MRLYVLHFAKPAGLQRAFDRVLASDRVASCTIEPVEGRLRFLAPDAFAKALVESIYLEGGLTWCTHHAVELPHEMLRPLGAPQARQRA